MSNPENGGVLPGHIAIIMDGNGRWAKARNLSRTEGHRRGAETTKLIVRKCSEIGIKFLTLYTFSTENWKRPDYEINFLMQLLEKFLAEKIKNLSEQNIRFLTVGKIEKLPAKVQNVLKQAKDETKNNTGLTLILALNYGSRLEIINAALSLSADIQKGKINEKEITEETFSRYMSTAGIPDPDLLIRTSGEMRLSNFLLWQLSYAELYISKKMWPDFDTSDLNKAIAEFSRRQRRFGGI